MNIYLFGTFANQIHQKEGWKDVLQQKNKTPILHNMENERNSNE
uniref:Uncharacterized protein n=1 Tax=Rhizophora mucronata TaxID=61149 RepID=A0A2P2QAM1_RHIMU